MSLAGKVNDDIVLSPLENHAALVIDMQYSFLYLLAKYSSPEIRDELISNQAATLTYCKARNVPVVFIENYGNGGTEVQLVNAMYSGRSEHIFKDDRSAFSSRKLESLLKSLKAERLIVMGVWKEHCVKDTIRDALQREYPVITAADLVGELPGHKCVNKWYVKNTDYHETHIDLMGALR